MKLKDLVPQGIKNIYHFFQAFGAALIYGFPSKKLRVIGVTGTDGKTTTVHLIHHVLKEAGFRVSMISTVKAVIGEATFDTGFHVTTPSPFEVQKFLNLMVKAGSKVAVLEVTSHGLDQNRVAMVDFHEAVITNITHEHLDYHKSYSSYIGAKVKILQGVKYRILNADDKSFEKISAKGSGKMISYSTRKEVDVMATNIKEVDDRVEFDANFKTKEKGEKKAHFSLPVPGIFNVYNALSAISVAKTFDVDNKVIARSLKEFPGVVGRMEKIEEGQNFEVIVDFAHTPAALEQIVGTLKNHTKGKLICVFGSAGERDFKKRPLMGEAAGKVCDFTIITAEDPRRENVNKIMDEIEVGTKKAGGILGQTYWKIPDRARAVRTAINTLAGEKDLVAIFGKGHEKSMNIGGVEYPWSDQMVAQSALKERLRK